MGEQNPGIEIGQTFRAPTTGRITHVQLYLQNRVWNLSHYIHDIYRSPKRRDLVHVGVMRTSYGLPTGEIVSSGKAVSHIPSWEWGWVDVRFVTPLQVETGRSYALNVVAPGHGWAVSCGSSFGDPDPSSGPYPDGSEVVKWDLDDDGIGDEWSAFASGTFDYAFRV